MVKNCVCIDVRREKIHCSYSYKMYLCIYKELILYAMIRVLNAALIIKVSRNSMYPTIRG